MNYATDFKSIRDQVSPEEWQARLDLAACYRLVLPYGQIDLARKLIHGSVAWRSLRQPNLSEIGVTFTLQRSAEVIRLKTQSRVIFAVKTRTILINESNVNNAS